MPNVTSSLLQESFDKLIEALNADSITYFFDDEKYYLHFMRAKGSFSFEISADSAHFILGKTAHKLTRCNSSLKYEFVGVTEEGKTYIVKTIAPNPAIKPPQVGDIVRYVPADTDNAWLKRNTPDFFAAIIIHVQDATTVLLCVFNPSKQQPTMPEYAIHHKDAPFGSAYWDYPPKQ